MKRGQGEVAGAVDPFNYETAPRLYLFELFVPDGPGIVAT